jgi:hypothetical protein
VKHFSVVILGLLVTSLACGGASQGHYARKKPASICQAPGASSPSSTGIDRHNSFAATPAPNVDAEAERESVLVSMRDHLERAGEATASIEILSLRVENDWAWLEVALGPKGSRAREQHAALFRKQDARWVVAEPIEGGGDLERLGLANGAAYVETLRTRHPQAPASVFPAL